MVDKLHPEASEFLEDLKFIAKAHRVDLPTMAEDVNALNKGVKRLKVELEQFKKTNQIEKLPEDRFLERYEPFLSQCTSEVEEILAINAEIEQLTVEVNTYFNTDKEVGEILDIWATFVTDYKETAAELEAIRVREEKIKRIAEAKVSL